MQDAHQAAEAAARASYGRLVAYLARDTHDLATAEDALADALVSALVSWPERGVPDNPDAWLLTAARRSHLGALRRAETARRNLPALRILAADDEPQASDRRSGPVTDRRLELLYVCAHPAIARSIHAPLMLQTILGLDAVRIAQAFLVAPATMGQRLSRAKAKIKSAGIAFEIPGDDDLPARTASVLDAVYAAYGSGWDDLSDTDPKRRGLTDEAVRLARLLVELAPDDAEAHGLLALMLHADARAEARRDTAGRFVPLDRQDMSRWSKDAMIEAETHLSRAASLRRPGPYQLHAAIQSVHNRRALTGATDWAAIAALYDGLVALSPALGAQVARAAAHGEASGADAGLALLDALPDRRVADYQPYWATRAHLLALLGRSADATHAARRAIGLTTDPANRAHLVERHLSGPASGPD